MDKSMRLLGLERFSETLVDLRGLSAEAGIKHMLDRFGLHNESAQTRYMERLLATVLGWSSQFKYVEWQKQLGYTVESPARVVDLLAVRMAYDYGVLCSNTEKYAPRLQAWVYSFGPKSFAEEAQEHEASRLYVYQLALELSYQRESPLS